MESLKELYRIGPGPSSSHTLAIQHACKYYLKHHHDGKMYVAELYGSLSLTGKGHMTDHIICDAFEQEGKVIDVRFMPLDDRPLVYANTMILKQADGSCSMTIYSIGGGAFKVEGVSRIVDDMVYPHSTMQEIEEICIINHWSLYDYVKYYEPDIDEFLSQIVSQMLLTVEAGLREDGLLPGALRLKKVAKSIHEHYLSCTDPCEKKQLEITSYAYACSEENASGHTVVTAPTLGSCGVIPAVLYYYHIHEFATHKALCEALAVAGIYGNIIKTNATLSGAEGGCQAEIGTACAMAAAACSYLEQLSLRQISYAAESGMEHHLGLTCDPVGGYVMIPCIERNGVAALRSMDAMLYAKHIGAIKQNRISFDMIVRTMNYTGKKLALELRETSLGGLAMVMPVKP